MKSKIKRLFTGIRGKVFISFFILIGLFSIFGVVSNYLANKNKLATEKINSVNQPSLSALMELDMLISQSKSLTSNWVKIDIEQHPDKIKLKKLHESDYPVLKNKLVSLRDQWTEKPVIDSFNVLLKGIEKNFAVQKEIMSGLATFDNYQDLMLRIDYESKNDQVAADINILSEKLNKILGKMKDLTSNDQVEMIDNMSLWFKFNIVVIIFIMALGLLLTLRLSNQIIKPVHKLQGLIKKVSKGELEKMKEEPGNDEIGDMMRSVQSMIAGLQTTANFANEIGSGKLDADFKPLSEKDALGYALLSMRDNLSKVAKEDKQRFWANEGFAVFGEILRDHYEDMNQMLDIFTSKLVKYLNANQGWLYVVTEEDQGEPFLELKSCYAFDRKKFVNKRINKGEGLAGQTWIEGELIYLTDIPKNYVSITSGLGDAPPTAILIVPVKVNDAINGVLELASFKPFQPFEIDFISKVSESLSSTLSTMKVNVQTKLLLAESQKQRQQMIEQEEEMRQNLEELEATQEEMQRKQTDTDILINNLRKREAELLAENQKLRRK